METAKSSSGGGEGLIEKALISTVGALSDELGKPLIDAGKAMTVDVPMAFVPGKEMKPGKTSAAAH